jgi:PAS domain S-box-containing protein
VIGLATFADFLLGWGLKLNEFSRRPTATVYTVFRDQMASCGAAFAALGIECAATIPRKILKGMAALAGVEIKILAGFLTALSLLVIGGGYTYRTAVEFEASVERVAHTQEVRATLAALYGSLSGAELAQRDYLLTGDAAPRSEYQRLTADVQRNMADLSQLIHDDALQQRNFAALNVSIAGRLHVMASGLNANDTVGLSAARAVLALGRTSNSTEEVRQLIERMDRAELHYLAEQQTAAGTVRRTTLASLLVTLAAAFALFIALFRGIHREMMARRDAEGALRASDRYNRSIVDSSPDCLAVITLDARLCQMTPQGRRLMDVEDFSAIENTDWLAFWTGAERLAAQQALDEARRGSAGRFQGYCPTRKGVPKWWDVIVMPIVGANGEAERLLAVARDISDVKRTETNLLEANRFLDSLIENLPLMVAVKDAATLNFVRQNRAFERLVGCSRDELIGKNARNFFTAEDADFITAKDREALEEGRLVDIPEQPIHTRDLGVRIFHTMKMPIGDRDGRPQYLLSIWLDITERKLAEQAIHELNAALEAKASQLEASNRELESFSYSVSHDLRAPLRAIDGFALMIEEDYGERIDAEGRRYLSVIRENSRRMGALIDSLLAFSRLGRLPVVTREVNVEALVREVFDEVLLAHDACQPRVELGPLPAVRGDRALLRQVWMNLVSNAVKYSSKAARPWIEVRGHRDAQENLYSIRDNGVGFDMEYAEKMFGVFQRLHRADEFTGTGVGLAIVHRVVTKHGGRVWAEGKVDEGAVFSFALPAGADVG